MSVTPVADGARGLDLREAAARMLELRELDRAMLALAADRGDNVLNGTVLHPYSGLEPLAVGIALARSEGDIVFGSHRGLGHCLAWGMDPRRAVAEVLGRRTGPGRGRGGHMHLVDASAGVGGTNGIVGAGIPLAVGAAYALGLRGQGNVVVTCFGDGATNTGAFHESLNLAVVWGAPVVFICEDNGITEAMRSSELTAADSLADRARGYGMPVHAVDGRDLRAVHAAAAQAMDRARRGDGPSAVIATVTRTGGHWSGDTQHYRDSDDVAYRATQDAVDRALRKAARQWAQDVVDDVRSADPPDRELLLLEIDEATA